MLLTTLAETSAAVGATRSRLAKRALLAETIKAATPAEIELVVTYLSGTLRQRRTGVGWASLGAAPAPAQAATLTVSEVDAAFEEISRLAGSGSAAERSRLSQELFARATEGEQRFLRGLVFDELRQGALDALVQDALASAYEVPAAEVSRAAMLLGSTAAAAAILSARGLDGLGEVRMTLGRPIRPMLAASAPDPAAALVKADAPILADAKLDGIRVQVHRAGAEIRIYTRSLDEITERLPEVVGAVAALPVQNLILDGEVVGLGADGRPLPFQVIASRTATQAESAGGRARVPLSLFAFDLLSVDGVDLLDEPLHRRADMLTRTLPPDMLVPRIFPHTEPELTEFFRAVVDQGYEGIVVKKLAAPYAAGRRDSGWIKVKPRHTFELAVIAAEWGSGRRQGWLSNLHLAARDADTGQLVMLGKTFKGLTDAVLTWQTAQFLARESRRTKNTVFVDPPLVAEIAFDGVQKSTRYPGRVALRFARVVRYRDDKTPEEVDSLQSVVELSPVIEDAP